MRRYILLLLFIGLVWGQNPCDDERFLKIKEKSLDDMTDREYQYFINKEKECTDYNSNNKINTPKKILPDDIYEKYLIALGCKKRDGKNYFYQDKGNPYNWIKIEDSWHYLSSLGYRKGENVNRPAGGIYKYSGGKWVQLGDNSNSGALKSSQNQQTISMRSQASQTLATIGLYGGMDFLGEFVDDINKGVGETTEKMKNGFSFGAEILVPSSNMLKIGAGVDYQMGRQYEDNDLSESGNLSFISLFGTIHYFQSPVVKNYGIFRIGTSIPNFDDDFVGEWNINNGLYIAGGGGFIVNQNTALEFIWSQNFGSASLVFDGDEYLSVFDYQKFSAYLKFTLPS